MSCFKTHIATTTAVEPDPTKHVNYQLGMVLGVDDFNQEFAYLSERDRWLARDVIGYGILRGLRVFYENDGVNGPRVVVGAGSALGPCGHLICVPSAQCASLNKWLEANAKDVPAHIGSPMNPSLLLFVTLSYKPCETDDVSIPGEACRDEQALTTPSRIADNFQLTLSFDPPEQREEKALRDFVAWMRQIKISSTVSESPKKDEFLKAIREAASPWLYPSSPLNSPPVDFMYGAPPATMQIRPEDVAEYLNAAFRLWVTELRPKWHGRWYGCAGETKKGSVAEPDNFLLLGRVDVPVLLDSSSGLWVVSENTTDKPEVTLTDSPYLIHLRMLQEWLLNNISQVSYLNGDVTGPVSDNVVRRLLGIPVDAESTPTLGQVLTCQNIDGKPQWSTASLHFVNADYSRNSGIRDYAIVAAGHVTSDGGDKGPVYNNLKAKTKIPLPPEKQEPVIRLTFNGYKQPNLEKPMHQYIVKALLGEYKGLDDPSIFFSEYEKDAIVLRVKDGGKDPDPRKQWSIELMVEVSIFKP